MGAIVLNQKLYFATAAATQNTQCKSKPKKTKQTRTVVDVTYRTKTITIYRYVFQIIDAVLILFVD